MRDIRIDNCKGVLIFVVVFGHLLELCNAGRLGNITYKLIYVFHMPAFIFFMGMVSKPKANRIIKNICLYIVFQTAYIAFDSIINGNPINIYFRRPYWLLWFTVVEIYYSVLCILISKYRINTTVLFIVSIAVTLLVGYVQRIGYDFSLSRAFTFLPYYFGGMIFKQSEYRNKRNVIVDAIALIGSLLLVGVVRISNGALYGSYSYIDGGYNPVIKLSLYIVSFSCILAMYRYMPNHKLKGITEIGMNTLPVYLFHGFIILAIRKYNFFSFGVLVNYVLAVCVAIAITTVLSRIPMRIRKVN